MGGHQRDAGQIGQPGTGETLDEPFSGEYWLMRSGPTDVPTALRIGRSSLRKIRQDLGWATGYKTIAAGVIEPATGLVLRPEIAARLAA